jgi:nucleoside-diphosphate-sugar epimerase
VRIAVAGSSGFVGSSIVRAAREQSLQVEPTTALRVDLRDDPATSDYPELASDWILEHQSSFNDFVQQISDVDAVVNAAGLASPQSSDRVALWSSNVALPAVVAEGGKQAGVRCLVHVSSAAVQGQRDPLDETLETEPFSLYAESKAAGEQAVLSCSSPSTRVILYRATSVHGVGRALTHSFASLARRRLVPIVRKHKAAVPVALIDNVAAGVLFCCTREVEGPVVLHPWEGWTTDDLALLFSGRRPILKIPKQSLNVLDSILRALAKVGSDRAEAYRRRLLVVLLGQRQNARRLTEAGFDLPYGRSEWLALSHLGSSKGRLGS